VTFALVPVVRRLSIRIGAVVVPGERRVHTAPTPTLGGTAMYVAFLAAMAVAYVIPQFRDNIFRGSSEPLGVVLGATVIFGVGLLDDLRDVSAPAKLAGQVAAAMGLYWLGVTMFYFRVPFADVVVLSPDIIPLITVVWVALMANAVNLIDGLDGLAAGVAAIAGLAAGHLIALAVHELHEREAVSPDLDRFIAAAAALLVYGAVEAVGAYGLFAVFAAGFAFRRREYEHELNERVHAGADRLQTLLELAALLLFGSMVTFAGLEAPGLDGWLVAPLLLLVIRPVLVWLLAGRGYLSSRHRLFLGAFGVRGIATLFYLAAAVHAGVLETAEEVDVFWTGAVVVLVSIVVHGIAASPLTRRVAA